jgi:hypothetical protein
VFECIECQRFLKYSIRIKSIADSEDIKLAGDKMPEFKKAQLKFSLLKTEISVPGFLLGAMTIMLFLLSFLLGIFVYDRATSDEKTPAYIIQPRKVIVYGMPKITVYPNDQPKSRNIKNNEVKIN